MGHLHKLKPRVIDFIIEKKHSNPDISCRALVSETEKKLGIKLSKSSINNILKREKISSPVGRRSQAIFNLEGRAEYGGFSFLLAIDILQGVSKIAAEVLANLSRHSSKSFLKDTENVFQSFLIFKSIFDTNLELTKCYNNPEIWALVGRRPPRSAYNRIIKAIDDSQLFAIELVNALRQGLRPISGFRFKLSDGTAFFVDAGQQAIWHDPVKISQYPISYYKSNSYIKKFITSERILAVFNIQETSIFSSDALNFLLSIGFQNSYKQIRQIELLDSENQLLDSKLIIGSDKMYFMLGFWPWQLEIMSEFERKPAKQKIIFSDFGVEFYYQIEEVSIPQHLAIREVKLLVVILKNSPLGAARIGILTNIPKDMIHNFLSYKELCYWFAPEITYKEFIKRSKEPTPKGPSLPSGLETLLKEINERSSPDEIFAALCHYTWSQFHYCFLPEEFYSWDLPRIKEAFLKQKAKIKRTKGLVVHNILHDSCLCRKSDIENICQNFNERGIRDSDDRLLWFQVKPENK